MSDNTYTGRGITLTDMGIIAGAEASWELGGLLALVGIGGERLAKMEIRHETSREFSFDGKFTALFNPNRVTLSRAVGWKPNPSVSPGEWSTELSISAANYSPGTLSLDVSDDRRFLYVHGMHIKDVEAFKQEIKGGFEAIVQEVLT